MTTSEQELEERFKVIDREFDPKRQAIFKAAVAMRLAQKYAVEAQNFAFAANLRDLTLDLLRVVDN